MKRGLLKQTSPPNAYLGGTSTPGKQFSKISLLALEVGRLLSLRLSALSNRLKDVIATRGQPLGSFEKVD